MDLLTYLLYFIYGINASYYDSGFDVEYQVGNKKIRQIVRIDFVHSAILQENIIIFLS